MSETSETNKCEFCEKVFKREITLGNHICPIKNRWLARSQKNSMIGYEAWKQFYLVGFNNRDRKYEEFIRSPFYNAFSRFGTYCMDAQVLNIPRFVDWLLKEQKKIDDWPKDTTYNKFLINYLRTEDPLDAIARSIETTINLRSTENSTENYLLDTNANKVCHQITSGRISPWMLYQSKSGVTFLSGLNPDQERMILPYIAPEQWAIRFIRDKEMTAQIKEILTAAGY
jgi:hypothetical protein